MSHISLFSDLHELLNSFRTFRLTADENADTVMPEKLAQAAFLKPSSMRLMEPSMIFFIGSCSSIVCHLSRTQGLRASIHICQTKF